MSSAPGEEKRKSRIGALLGRLFLGYTLEDVGGSRWVPTGVLFTFRFVSGCALIGMMGMAVKRRLWAAAIAPVLGILLAVLLCTVSFLHMRRKTNKKLPQVVGPLYQTGASVALFLCPLVVLIHITSHDSVRGVIAAANSLPAAVFLADTLLMGARVRFRLPFVVVPVLLELIAVFAPLGTSGWFKSVPEGTANVSNRPVILVSIIAVCWSILSALGAVLVTRANECCDRIRKRMEEKRKNKERKEEEAEDELDVDDMFEDEEKGKREIDSPV